jgi:transposase InsO family protein
MDVADFTYVPLDTGRFGYTAFVVDAYAELMPGWECSLTKDTGFVERALRDAAAFRARQGYPFDDTIHHSDAGSHYTAIYYGETLMLEGLIASIGTVGDAARQRSMRDHDRALQDRVRAPRLPVSRRSDPHLRRPEEHDLGVR